LSTLKDKTDNAEAVLASAVNRVLGYIAQSAVPGDLYEPQIMEALKSVLSKVPEYKPAQTTSFSQTQHNGTSQTHNSQANQEGLQKNASQQPAKPAGPHQSPSPAVMRPSFGGAVNRPNGAAISRPSIPTPGMSPGSARINSASPAPLRTERPPSVESIAVSAQTPTSVSTKEPIADASSAVNTTGGAELKQSEITLVPPPPEDMQSSPTVAPVPGEAASVASQLEFQADTSLSDPSGTDELKSVSIIAERPTGQKRSIEDVDGKEDGDLPESKRVAISGSAPLTI
jgi:hypothetical protein